MDNTHRDGSAPIDSITTSPNMMEYVEECKLIKTRNIVLSDYCGCIVNTNIEKYFGKQLSGWDQINRRIVDSSRRSHRKQFP